MFPVASTGRATAESERGARERELAVAIPDLGPLLADEGARERGARGVALPIEEQRAVHDQAAVDATNAERVQAAQHHECALVGQEGIAARLDQEIAFDDRRRRADRSRAIGFRSDGRGRVAEASARVVAILVTEAG